MKVLVVHDRDVVANQIVEVLEGAEIPGHQITVCQDGVGARTALQNDLFDLAVIDLTLPHIRGRTEPGYSTAEDLLLEIFNSDSLNVPGDVIGITRDKMAFETVHSEIGSHLMAVVEEEVDSRWRNQLADKIQYVVRAANSRLMCASRYFDYDVAIITALDTEFAPYAEIFELSDLKGSSGIKSFLFQDQAGNIRRGVGCAIGRAGQASSASQTQSILTQFRPKVCLMSGFCGGFAEKTQAGEVLIAEAVFDWDCGKWKGAGDAATFVPRPDPISVRGSRMHTIARALVQERLANQDAIVGQLVQRSDGRINQVKMKIGPIASGSSVIAHSAIISRIQSANENLLGADMEAYGFYYASNHTFVARPDFLLIKAVADFCDRQKDDANQSACSFLSAKVSEELIRRYCTF